MNKPLFEKVIAAIQADPRRLNMNMWAYNTARGASTTPECGTAGCIAGWTVLISKHESKVLAKEQVVVEDLDGNWPGAAQRLLDITDDQEQALFYADWWPSPFREEYELADKNEEASPELSAKLADITIRRIRQFMETEQ
jgi:hypothetical protein